MLDILRSLIGVPPAGLSAIEYVFAFVLVLIALVCVAYVAHLPLEWIGSFHNRHK